MASTSGSIFSATLQTITTPKLEELAKQRLSFEKQYDTLVKTTSAEPDALKRLFLLVDGAKACLGVQTTPSKGTKRGRVLVGSTSNPCLEKDLKNLDRFLEQARYDPSVSPKVLKDWEDSIHRYLSNQSAKYQYADLYGKLVTEWLTEKTAPTDGDIEMTESFEELPGAKKMEARTEWEKVVFEPAQTNIQGLRVYLQNLYVTNKKEVAKSLNRLRAKVEQFERSISGPRQFSVPSLRWVIEGLQTSDLLSNEKREVLKDFLRNDVILAEIADVLNMRMAALDRWSWGDHVPLEQRRKLNGGYSIHMHEDLLQAIFLHYIGVKWSVFFKSAFVAFRHEAAKSNHADVPKIDSLRRQYYLGPNGTFTHVNLQSKRTTSYQSDYFAHQLLDFCSQKVEMQEGEEEAEFNSLAEEEEFDDSSRERPQKRAKLLARKSVMAAQAQQSQMSMMQQRSVQPAAQMPAQHYASGIAVNHDGEERFQQDKSQAKNPMYAKQNLLHLLATEIVLNTYLHGQLTCFHSVFDSWNPLLPHETILTVLDFIGVSPKWRTFFKTFLQAPLKFIEDQISDSRLRRRGTPGSHALSDVFGEVVFACLDFAVNQSTNGGMLHRLYDDIWFWGNDYETCVKAWASVTQFSDAMGVQLNKSKSGSARISRDDSMVLTIDDRLPEGEIRWGFLYLDSKTGRFDIDEKMVTTHIEELRKQLQGKSKSVIDWIQTWNTYAATFISSNFGKAANCFGRQHVDKMLATHRRVQESIFDGGNVVQFLKKTIEERFQVKDIPDGFLFFPVELGGLDLKSPFVGLLQIRESVKEHPTDFMDEFQELEREDYMYAKQAFERGALRHVPINSGRSQDPSFRPEHPDTFFSFEEYTRYREEYSPNGNANLVAVYSDLLKRPVEESIDLTVQMRQAVEGLCGQSNLRGITGEWHGMEAYWKWVAQMYGPEMVARFGGLNVVDPGLLPVGMVSMFRQKRIKMAGLDR